MTTMMETRDFAGLDLEVRSDGRTVHGICVPYDTPTLIPDKRGSYEEVFRLGAFSSACQNPDKVKFLRNHNRDGVLGRAQVLREDASGLYGEFRVSKTTAGDEAIELIRDGALDGLSVGFYPKTNRGTPGIDDVVERLAAKLYEVSATAFAAYGSALIGGVRSLDGVDISGASIAERRALLLQL